LIIYSSDIKHISREKLPLLRSCERSGDVTDYNGKLTTKHTSEEEFNVESRDVIDEQEFVEFKDRW